MSSVRGRSLPFQLVVLCLGLLLPTLAFVGLLLWRLADSEATRADEQVLVSSRALATALDREIDGVLATLQALATSPSLQSRDLGAFYAQISEVHRVNHVHIVLRDLDGHVLLTTRAPPGTTVVVPPALREADRVVVATDRPLVTDMFNGPTTDASVFQILARPVRVADQPAYILGASLEPDYLANAFRREGLPPAWIGSLADRNLTVVARTAEQERFVGQPSSPALQEHAKAASSGTYRGLSVAGVDSLVGFTRSEMTGWTASVNVPVSIVDARFHQTLNLLLASGAVLTLFAGVLTALAGRRIIVATRRLATAADAIGAGRSVARVETPIAEINLVGDALHRAAEHLEERARERDAAEASVRDSEAHLSGIFAQTGAGLAEAELDGTIINTNDHYCALVGRSADELRGMRLSDITHPEDSATNDAIFRRVLEGDGPVTAEKRFVRGDGVVVFVANTVSLITGTRQTLLSVAIDISEQKRVEADLAAARDAAEAANLAKSNFIANMSHELRTPLSAIIGYSEMLKEEVADGTDLAALETDLGKIESNARHLLGLINDVLDLSKIESGKMEVFAETFAVEPMLRDVAATVDGLVRKKNNQLELQLGSGLGTMHSDVIKIRQVLLNLLSNAAKFSENETVTLSATREAETLVFSVRDRGIGMSEEQLAKLFQRFSQADASTTRRFGGTGLGLSITKAFTTMLDGAIDVSSQPGEGSCFTLRIPAHRAPDAATPDAAAHDVVVPDALPQEVVLIIDDDPAQRDIMRRFLEREGFAAHAAADGVTGLDLARRLRPRAILLDVTMPGLDGWSVLRRLKADAELASIPVIMVTFIHDNGLSAALGAEDHITKPVRWDAFRKTMDRFRDRDGDVLIVDDNEDARLQMRAALERDGWTVSEAANGQEALDQVAHHLPRVVLLDLEMPVMDGFAFLRAFHERPGCHDIPVVVVTARDLSRADRDALEGASTVISKADGLRKLAANVLAATQPHT